MIEDAAIVQVSSTSWTVYIDTGEEVYIQSIPEQSEKGPDLPNYWRGL